MVRRASTSPSRCRMLTIFESLSGLRGSSASMILRMRCLIVTDETLSPYELLMPLWKKILHLEHALRRVHVLVGHDAADRRLVHADVVGDVAQHERPQVLDAVIEEVALEVDDAGRDLVDRLLPLLHRLDQPQRRAELVFHVGARLVGVLRALLSSSRR